MKKIVLILAIAILPMVSFSQSIFDQFEDQDGVTSVVVNQNMFKLLSKIDVETNDPESQEYINMIENLTSLKVLTTGDEAISAKMKGEVDRYLKKSKLSFCHQAIPRSDVLEIHQDASSSEHSSSRT